MRKRTFLIYATFIWTKTLLGLTFTPFISVREVVRRPVLFPVIFSPFLGIIMILILSRIATLFIETQGMERIVISMFLSTTVISILLWQLLLLYLLASYLIALWRKS
ncbi:MAG: hypothetical protein KGL95_07860 [Patescibacteria group bacterium]|nr:hypothetical protein [Patescibacteria group bacterium]